MCSVRRENFNVLTVCTVNNLTDEQLEGLCDVLYAMTMTGKSLGELLKEGEIGYAEGDL